MFKTIFLIFFEIVFLSHCIGQEKKTEQRSMKSVGLC